MTALNENVEVLASKKKKKINKMYLRVQFRSSNVSSHQLIRADKIPGFRAIIESKGFNDYVRLIAYRVDLHMKVSPDKPFPAIEPYKLVVTKEDYARLNSEVLGKMSTVYNMGEFPEFNLVFNSNSNPVIKILKEKVIIKKEEK